MFFKNLVVTLMIVFFIGFASFFMAKKIGLLNRIESTTQSFAKNETFDQGNYRQYFWRTYEKMFFDKPIIGQGTYWLKQGVREEYYNKMGYEKLPEKYIAHNVYLETLGSAGLLGFFWVIFGLIFLCKALNKNIFYKSSKLNPISIAFVFAFIANLIHGITQNVFFDSSVVYIYICLIVVLMWEKAFEQNDK